MPRIIVIARVCFTYRTNSTLSISVQFSQHNVDLVALQISLSSSPCSLSSALCRIVTLPVNEAPRKDRDPAIISLNNSTLHQQQVHGLYFNGGRYIDILRCKQISLHVYIGASESLHMHIRRTHGRNTELIFPLIPNLVK